MSDKFNTIYENNTTKRFICPICGTRTSLKVKSSVSSEAVHNGNVCIQYIIPKIAGFNIYCTEHGHIMIGGDEDEFEFVKTMFDAGIYVDYIYTGGQYDIIAYSNKDKDQPYFNPLRISLNASSECGISYNMLDSIIEQIRYSNKEYYDTVLYYQDEDSTIHDDFANCERFDIRTISIEVQSDNSEISSIEDRIKFHNRNRDIFINFYKALADRVNKEMKHIDGGTSNE